ncbi:MAG: O-antigen ligase family protein [Flavobacteriaceae bacterium]
MKKLFKEELQFNRAYYYAALGFALLIPFDQKWVTIALLVWVFLSLITFGKKGAQKNKFLLLLPALYLSYALGLFTSVEPSYTFLEYKLSLIAFPLLFFLHHYSEKERKNILKGLIYGLLAVSIVCFLAALYRSVFFEEGALVFKANVEEGRGFFEAVIFGGNQFFGQHFSFFHQTVYFAMYLCAGIAILLHYKNIFSTKFRWLLIALFTLEIFLISNKAGIVVVCAVFLISIITAKTTKLKKAAALGLLALLIGTLAYTNPRLNESIGKLFKGEISLDKEARYDYKTRSLCWDAALELIQEKPLLGYGLGDTQKALNKVYAEKEYKVPLAENFNAHNLFMQLWLENGLIGLLLLILIFGLLFKKAFGTKEPLGFILMILAIFLINGLFESFFSRFSGISFFAFFISFIYTQTNATEKNIES